MKKIQCFTGSPRIESTRITILYTNAERYENKTNFAIYSSLVMLPHFHPYAEDTSLPHTVQHARAEIAAPDAVIICTPECVFSVPTVLKNSIDSYVASTVFPGKPTAMIVASGVGEKTF